MNFKTSVTMAMTFGSLLISARADITNGLVLYYNLDQTTGSTVSDSSGLGNNGTIQNFTDDLVWTKGWINGGLFLTNNAAGVTNYILVPDAASLSFTNENTFTLAAWIKTTSAQRNGSGIIARGSGGGGEQYDLDVQGNRYRVVVRNAARTATTATATVAPANNVWQHVAAVYDGTNTISKTIKIYLNGILNISVTNNANLTSLLPTNHVVTIGARQLSTTDYNLVVTNTALDEVRIYNRPLSASDIYDLYSLNGRVAVITTQPRSVTNYEGDYAAFAVGIDNNNSTLPVGYQWKSNGVPISGATNTTLVLTNVQLAWSGLYSVSISNVIGITNSAIAYLQAQPLPAPNITANLAGYWKLDDASGSLTAADSSGNGNSGTLTGFADLSSVWISGLTNGALSFNGDASTANVVAIPSVGNPGPAVLDFSSNPAFTLSAWVKASLPQTNGAAIICRGSGGGGEQYALDVNTGTYRFYVRNTNAASVNLTTTIGPNGTWQHVAAVFDAINNIMNFYVNGQLVNLTVAPTSLNTNTHEVSIGNRQSGAATAYNLPLTGALDDVRIYGRALTLADIQALYATGGLYPPAFTIHPTGGSLYIGDAFTLSGTVSGTFPIAFQWRKNGTNFIGATNSLLTFTNIQLSDAGAYTLFASNTYGMDTSAVAVVQVSHFDLTNALAGFWKFDDGTGVAAADSSGNGNIGSLNGFAGDDSQWVLGRIAGALNYNADGAGATVVTVPDAATLNFDTTLKFSLAVWVRGPAAQTSSAGIIAKGTGGGGEAYALDVFGGVFRFFVRNAAGTATALSSPVAPNGRWQHVVAVYDGVAATMRIYVNGQLVTSSTAPTSLLLNSHEVSIGSRQSAAAAYNLPFTGRIDDARIYGRALNAFQVQELYSLASPLAPVIYTQPQSVSRYVGDNVTFTVSAEGDDPLTFQWQKNGTNLVGATTVSLTLSNVNFGDAGSYRLAVTNLLGNKNSASAVLTVLAVPLPDLTNLLVAYWTFDEASGLSLADASGNLNSATLYDFPLDDSQWVTNGGVLGGALHFTNAVNPNYRVATDAALNGLQNGNQFTFSFWARRDPGAAGVNPRFFAPVAGQNWVLWTPGRGVGFFTPLASTEPAIDTWHHFVVLFDRLAGAYSLYVDGVLQVAEAAGYSRTDPSSQQWFIGHSESATSTSDSWTGLLDEARIYNRLLTLNDVRALYFMVGQPQLRVVNNGGSVSLSWPVGAVGFHLQGAGALAGPGSAWTNVSPTPVVSADGIRQTVTEDLTAGTKFYRLQKP